MKDQSGTRLSNSDAVHQLSEKIASTSNTFTVVPDIKVFIEF